MPQTRCRILVSNANYKHTLGAMRALVAAGYDVDLIGRRISAAGLSRYAGRIVCPDSVLKNDRIDDFIALIRRERYSAFIPIGAGAVHFASRHRDAIQAVCGLAVPAMEVVDLAMDKFRLPMFAVQHDVNAPRSWLVERVEKLPEVIAAATFPLVVKRRGELSTGGTFYVHDADELRKSVERWLAGSNEAPVVQEFVEGEGRGFFALYRDGEMLRSFMHKRVREMPPEGGPSCCAESIDEEDLRLMGKRLLDALRWHGVAMVEFKRSTIDGRLQLMELNSKFWGSLDLAIECGVEFPVLLTKVALNEPLPPIAPVQVNKQFHWLFGGGEIQHALRRPSAWPAILRAIFDGRVAGNNWLKDPLPTGYFVFYDLFMIARTLWRVLRGA